MNNLTKTAQTPCIRIKALKNILKAVGITVSVIAAFTVDRITVSPTAFHVAWSQSHANAVGECDTSSSFAGDDGLKRWCWSDLAAEINSLTDQSFIDDGKLFTSVHHYPDDAPTYKPVEVIGDNIVFTVTPRNPLSNTKPSRQGERSPWNYRSEIRDAPSNVDHPNGTEQWWGFNYTFGDDYIIDDLPWIMWQTHADESIPNAPMQALEVASRNYGNAGNTRGEIVVANNAYSRSGSMRLRTGVVPQAGQTVKVVIQMVWGTETTGLLRIWLDDVLVYDEQQRTSYSEHEEGGYWKAGIYKWRWQHAKNIATSESLGISRLQTSIGTMRVIKNDRDDTQYLAPDQYALVDPAQQIEVSKLEMRLRGTTGTEKIRARIGGALSQGVFFDATTQERTVSADFHVTPQSIASILVDFVNDGYHDGIDKNVFIDWIKVNDERIDTEDPRVYSTGTATRSTGCAPGYKKSEWLHCNGSLAYPISSAESDTIAVRLRGTTGSERIEMRSNGQVIANLNAATRYSTLLTTLAQGQSLSESIELKFVNDGWANGVNRNIQIDWIEINGNRIETEDPSVHSTGTYTRGTRCAPGYKQSEWLHCNGAFTFRP